MGCSLKPELKVVILGTFRYKLSKQIITELVAIFMLYFSKSSTWRILDFPFAALNEFKAVA